jgi:glucosylceramidase
LLQINLVPAAATLGVKPRTGATAVRGSTLQLAPQVVTETGATYSAIVWSSSNTVIATVDDKGLVSAGTATGSAIVKLRIGTLEGTSSITVVDLGGAGVTIQ